MKSTAAVLGVTALAAAMLSACGGQSAYCQAVDDRTATLNAFGTKRTDAAFLKDAKAMSDIAQQSPASIKPEWTAIGKATRGVVEVHRSLDIPMQDLGKVELTPQQRDTIQQSYDAYNATSKQRKLVVADVADSCDIELK
ncbi:MAG: hypothetical protein JWP31_311 [Aeromicrobium sp.]|nr:hypothetical protein [Aeromicrobium sp.]